MTTMTDSDPLTEWHAGPLNRVAAPLRERVTDILRQAILDFELQPGQRLVERELIDRLQISRTTLRESLRELTSEGLVTVIPQRGAIVASISPTEAADLYDARVAIESLVVERFIKRATDEQTEQLRNAIKDLRTATGQGLPTRQVLAVKNVFYDVLQEGAQSPVLSALLSSLHARVSVLRATSLAQPGRTVHAVEELERLVEAIARRDTKAATRLCATHVRNAAKTGIAALENSLKPHRLGLVMK